MGEVAAIQTNANESVTSTATSYNELQSVQAILNAQVVNANASVLGAPVLEVQGLMSSGYTPALVVTPTVYDAYGTPVYVVPARTGALTNIAVSMTAILVAAFATVF